MTVKSQFHGPLRWTYLTALFTSILATSLTAIAVIFNWTSTFQYVTMLVNSAAMLTIMTVLLSCCYKTHQSNSRKGYAQNWFWTVYLFLCWTSYICATTALSNAMPGNSCCTPMRLLRSSCPWHTLCGACVLRYYGFLKILSSRVVTMFSFGQVPLLSASIVDTARWKDHSLPDTVGFRFQHCLEQ